jgi:hypothetical protein
MIFYRMLYDLPIFFEFQIRTSLHFK